MKNLTLLCSFRRQMWLAFLLSLAASVEAGSEQENRLDELRQDIQEQQKSIRTTSSRRNRLERQLESSEKEISNLIKETRALQEALGAGEQKVTELKTRQADIRRQKAGQQERIVLELRAIQQMGRVGPLRMLLNQQDPQLFARMITYYQSINQARALKFEEYRATIRQLNQVQRETERQLVQQERRQARLESRQNSLQQTQSERQQLLVQLNASLGSQHQRLERLMQDYKELEAVLSRVTAPARSGRQPFDALKGKMQLPVQGGILNRYGSRRGRAGVRWQGVFIEASEGSEVRAIHEGEVVFADWLRGFGLMLIVNHGQGYMSLYGYNRVLHKETGDQIQANEVIAETGSTGGQEQSGSYFEIRHNGKPRNPEAWCVRRAAS